MLLAARVKSAHIKISKIESSGFSPKRGLGGKPPFFPGENRPEPGPSPGESVMRLTDMRFVPRRRRRIRSARRRGVEDSPLTAGVRCAMAMLMENDGTSILREVIEHCNDRWV